MPENKPTNKDIAAELEQIADLLETQDANPFRIRAYRQAANSILKSELSLAELVKNNQMDRIKEIEGIGNSIAGTIKEYVNTGRIGLLERLRGSVSPESLFMTVPGIGEDLAKKIVHKLDIDKLEDLEVAAWDGSLQKISGIGKQKLKTIRAVLNSLLSYSSRRRSRRLEDLSKGKIQIEDKEKPVEPSVATILDVDQEYREKAAKNNLRKIAPKRFNPEGKAWLPILHTGRADWHFTVLFSNTAQAHKLNKTDDWVVIFYEKDGVEDQATVVTEIRGDLKGKRVVRGREQECKKYYSEE